MGMLTKDDLKQIGEVMDDKFFSFDKKVDEKFVTFDKKVDDKFFSFDKKVDDKFSLFDGKVDEKLVTFEDRLVGRIVGDVGEVFEQNFMPAMEMMVDEKLEAGLAPIKAAMVTKSYLDDKLADLKGDLIGHDRKLERKTDMLVGALVEHRALTASDVERLEASRVFPRTKP